MKIRCNEHGKKRLQIRGLGGILPSENETRRTRDEEIRTGRGRLDPGMGGSHPSSQTSPELNVEVAGDGRRGRGEAGGDRGRRIRGGPGRIRHRRWPERDAGGGGAEARRRARRSSWPARQQEARGGRRARAEARGCRHGSSPGPPCDPATACGVSRVQKGRAPEAAASKSSATRSSKASRPLSINRHRSSSRATVSAALMYACYRRVCGDVAAAWLEALAAARTCCGVRAEGE